jgi:predicted ATPase/class 3 adenylate cyclase
MTKVRRGSSPAKALPTGTVTFLFTDIENSTALVQRLGAIAYRELLEEHQRLLRAAFAAHGGIERSTEGDSFFVVFRDAPSAVAAAIDAQRALSAAGASAGEAVRVRMGLHVGEGILGGDDYVGLDVHRAARIASAAHGGQVIISESTQALTRRTLPDRVDIGDLGEFRLTGLAAPERLYQLNIYGLPSTFPPPRSEPIGRAHLPPRLTSFVGRQGDLESLASLLAGNRLVTLVGPGGAGKTSLATECARGVSAEFVDGSWFVALEAISDPELVPSAIIGALGLQDSSGRPAREQLYENLARRELLLVLDNFEQVMPAATLVDTILISAPGVKVVSTSRAPLHLSAEQVYPVAPLPIPAQSGTDDAPVATVLDAAALEELLAVPSVRLFIDRAQRVQPSFQLSVENARAVADICARLDGLPLGIELAAARVPLLGAVGVSERLARHVRLPAAPTPDAPARQRTLNDAIAWSYALLDAPGQALFARLSIFVGGWRLEEAEAVCGPDVELGADVLDTLATLVDQSLVVAREQGGTVRYEMLETIRRFASERLASSDDHEETGRRHARVYLAMAEASAPAIRRRSRVAILARIDPERDNLRAALRWSIEHEDVETALRLSTALVELRGAPPWGVGAGVQEARSTILTALELPGADAPTTARMRALEAAGTAFYYTGDNRRAGSFYQAQLQLAEALDDPQGAADARHNLAWTTDWTGRFEDAESYYERVDADYRALGDERGQARALFMHGSQLLAAGRPRDSIEVLEEAMRQYRELDDMAYALMTAGTIGSAYLELGDRNAAVHWFISGIIVAAREVGDELAATMSLPIGAAAAIELGRPEAAAMLMGAHESLSRMYGIDPPIGLKRVFDTFDPLARAIAQLDPAVFDAALERGREMRLDQAVALVLEMDVATQDPSAGPGIRAAAAATPADVSGHRP